MELGALEVLSLDFFPHMPGPTLEKWNSELKPQFVKKKKNFVFFLQWFFILKTVIQYTFTFQIHWMLERHVEY